jgi:hypothetical protein
LKYNYLKCLDRTPEPNTDPSTMQSDDFLGVAISGFLAILLPPVSIARILPVMAHCCDTYDSWKYSEQK